VGGTSKLTSGFLNPQETWAVSPRHQPGAIPDYATTPLHEIVKSKIIYSKPGLSSLTWAVLPRHQLGFFSF